MKKYNFYQLFALLLVLLFFEACSKKNFPANSNADPEAKYESTTSSYIPPLVISIDEELSKINKDGEMYYDDEVIMTYMKQHLISPNPLPFSMSKQLPQGAFITDAEMHLKWKQEEVKMSVEDFAIKLTEDPSSLTINFVQCSFFVMFSPKII